MFAAGEGWSEDEWRLPLILSSRDNAGFSSIAGPSPWILLTLVSRQPHAQSHDGSVTLPPLTLSSRDVGFERGARVAVHKQSLDLYSAQVFHKDFWAEQ